MVRIRCAVVALVVSGLIWGAGVLSGCSVERPEYGDAGSAEFPDIGQNGGDSSRSKGTGLCADDAWESYQLDSLRDLWAGNLESKQPKDPTNRVAQNDRAARLGHFLFYDEGLSGDDVDVSCSSCHQPDHAFTAPTKLADQGAGETKRNAATILNVGHQRWYFWDGRADTLWAQAVQPIENPIEMASSRLEVAHYVYSNDNVREAYESIEAFDALPDLSDTNRFPEEGRPVDDPQSDEEQLHQENWESMSAEDQDSINQIMANVTKSIAAFEMRVNNLDTPFDAFAGALLNGDGETCQDAISDKAKKGAKLFLGEASCRQCHNDVMFSSGGGKFHNVAPGKRDWIDWEDDGRKSGIKQWKDDEFNAAGDYSDAPDGQKGKLVDILTQSADHNGAMKVPPLRNIENTGPYMHAGHFETLRDVLEFYNDLDEEATVGTRTTELSPLDFSDKKLDQLEAFLKTLSPRDDVLPEKYRSQPSSPTP